MQDDETDTPEEECIFQCKLRQCLSKIFDGKANMTVLLTEMHMDDIRRAIKEDYTEVLLDQTLEAQHGVEVHMRCASHLLGQFWAMQQIIVQTKMASTAREMIFLELQQYILPRLTYELEELKPNVASLVITWMNEAEEKAKREACELELSIEWLEEKNNLLQFYFKHAVREETRKLLDEILALHSHDDVRRDAEGKLITGMPEQCMYVIKQQIRIASECLPHQYLEIVVMICNVELAQLISAWTLKILSEWKTMDSAYFCSIINDSTRLCDYCDSLKDGYLSRPTAVEYAESLTRDISELSLQAVRYLGENIIQRLREPTPILTTVGDPEWEDPELYSPVDCTIATLKDFFVDIEDWLMTGYFFPKVIKTCFDLALKTYLESFFANTMMHSVKDPLAVAEQLEQDYLRFVVYFNGEHFEDFHGHGGFYTKKSINDRLRILQHMAALVDPTNIPSNLSFEIQEILATFGQDDNGDPAVLHLVGLRKQHQRSTESVKWLKQIASAKKVLAERPPELSPLLCTLPDIRNSKMLQNIEPPPRERMPREFSSASMPFALSTARLLERPNRFVSTRATGGRSPMSLVNPAWKFSQRRLKVMNLTVESREMTKNAKAESRDTTEESHSGKENWDSEDDDVHIICPNCTMAEF